MADLPGSPTTHSRNGCIFAECDLEVMRYAMTRARVRPARGTYRNGYMHVSASARYQIARARRAVPRVRVGADRVSRRTARLTGWLRIQTPAATHPPPQISLPIREKTPATRGGLPYGTYSNVYLLRIILMKNGYYDPSLGLAEGSRAESYGARNLSPRPNGWRNLWR